MIGATIFWIAGIAALPPVLDRLTSVTAQNCVYWLPQVIGGSGFIVSGTLFMLETQKEWYIPAPKVLGWHIAVWNLIGVCFPSWVFEFNTTDLLTADRALDSRSVVRWASPVQTAEQYTRRALVRIKHLNYFPRFIPA
jgi:hypothetical protein